ncbi:MAG: transglycosylase domain-containing protein, partial [Solirubrobacterales bacterium]|nr:transglycosylase domain-containing protein [Solirubrobacterales bacterium]
MRWLFGLAFLGVLALILAVYVTYKMIDIPNPNSAFEAQTTTVFYSDGHHVLGHFALQNRESIPLQQVPRHVQNAVISAENRTFRTDSGVDPKGIVRAAWNNLRSDSTQGASTITQQYVKVLYLSQERTWKRKIKEAFLAVKIDNTLTKDQILEGYLNTIYYGRGAYGIQAAAQAYFEKDAKELTVPQGAVLAAVLNSPGTLDPAAGKASRTALLGRYRYVIDGMA